MDLEQLIEGCIKKDRKAQERLYNTYRKKLFPVCLQYCRSHAEAEDHLHDVFILIFTEIRKYRGQGSFEGWMKRIAINKAIDRYRKNLSFDLDPVRAERLAEESTALEEDVPLSIEALLELIQQLPNQYRLIFNLYEIDGYAHQEIANLLGISTGTSKSNLHRAKALLKNRILMEVAKLEGSKKTAEDGT